MVDVHIRHIRIRQLRIDRTLKDLLRIRQLRIDRTLKDLLRINFPYCCQKIGRLKNLWLVAFLFIPNELFFYEIKVPY